VIMSPAGLGPKNDCTGEDQLHLQTTNPSSRQREYYTRTITATVKLENKITGLEYQVVCRQDELIGGKLSDVK
jgi:hypothetical protein